MFSILLLNIFCPYVLASTISLNAKFAWNWDLENNCGPKPQGPFYPSPDPDSNRTVSNPSNCDILPNATYVFDYECETTCQEKVNSAYKNLNILASKYFGPVKQVIPCTWQYKDDESCPEVPLSAQYDWECDPRDGPCKDGQYPPEEKEDPDGVNSTNPGGNPFSWTDQYNLGSNANPFASFPRPGGGGPIIISPVMTQTIGNINASGGPGSNLRPHSPADFNMNNYDGHTHQNGDHDEEPQTSTTATNNASEIQKKNLLIAETKEKLRSLKSLLRASKEGHKREKEQYEVLQKTAVESFQRERLAFARERDSIVGRYEAALQAKDAARQDTLDQLNKMQDLLHINIYHMDRSDSNGEQMEMDKSIPNVRDEQKFNGMQKVSTGKHRTEKGRLPEEQEELLVFNDDEPMSDRVNKIKNIRSDR